MQALKAEIECYGIKCGYGTWNDKVSCVYLYSNDHFSDEEWEKRKSSNGPYEEFFCHAFGGERLGDTYPPTRCDMCLELFTEQL